MCVARGVAVRWMRGCLGRGRGARVRLAASGGLASSALRRSLADGFAVCKAMQNSNQARWKCHSCPAVQSLASLPSVLLDASWQARGAASIVWGPLAAQIGGAHTLIAKPVLRTQPQRRASCIRAGRGLLASPHCPAAAQRTPRDAAAAHKAMGFGAGDIKDKFRTYDGDADKRLRKKLEKSGKFDESFKTPVRIEKINVEVMGRWVSERLAELLGFEDDVLSELVMNMCVLGVPRCCGAFTPSTRLVFIRRGRGWFLFRFRGHSDRVERTAMLRAGQNTWASRRSSRRACRRTTLR